MKLNFNPTQNQIFNAYRINQSAAAKNGKAGAASAEESRKDLALISPQGKKSSLIDTLMKQKMNIMDQKNSLISSAKKDGKSMDSIQSQVEAYEKQLKDIDQQISEAMAKEMEEQAEKSKKDDEPKTKQEIENERMANVMDLSQGLEKAAVVDSVKTRVDGEARVLKSEIALDEMRGASKATIEEKEDQLSDLEKKSNELLSEAGEIVADTVETAKAQNELAASKEKEDDERTAFGGWDPAEAADSEDGKE